MVTHCATWRSALAYANRRSARTGRRHVVKRVPALMGDGGPISVPLWGVAEVGVL